MGLLDVFTGKATKKAAREAAARAEKTKIENQGILTGALDKGTGYLKEGIAGYQPLSEIGQGATQSYQTLADFLGLNGADGQARAQQAFQNSELGAGLGIATDAIMRQQNSLGMMGGNTIDALRARSAQEVGNYYDRLSGYGQQGLSALGTAAQGQQQGYTTLADLERGIAGMKTGVNDTATGIQNDAAYRKAAAQTQGGANLLNFGMNLANLGMGGIGRF